MDFCLVLLLSLPQDLIIMLAQSIDMATRRLFALTYVIVVEDCKHLVRCPLAPHLDSHGTLYHIVLVKRPGEGYQHVFAATCEPHHGSYIWNENIERLERFLADLLSINTEIINPYNCSMFTWKSFFKSFLIQQLQVFTIESNFIDDGLSLNGDVTIVYFTTEYVMYIFPFEIYLLHELFALWSFNSLFCLLPTLHMLCIHLVELWQHALHNCHARGHIDAGVSVTALVQV